MIYCNVATHWLGAYTKWSLLCVCLNRPFKSHVCIYHVNSPRAVQVSVKSQMAYDHQTSYNYTQIATWRLTKSLQRQGQCTYCSDISFWFMISSHATVTNRHDLWISLHEICTTSRLTLIWRFSSWVFLPWYKNITCNTAELCCRRRAAVLSLYHIEQKNMKFLGLVCKRVYPPETHVKFKSHEISFLQNICSKYPIVLKMCAEYGSVTAVLGTKFSKRLDN